MSLAAQLIMNYNLLFVRMVSYVVAVYCLIDTSKVLLRRNKRN